METDGGDAMVSPSEPSFPVEGGTLDLERSTNPFKLKWGDRVPVGETVVVDTGIIDILSPMQVIRLIARHSKGIWSEPLSFASVEEKREWDEVQEVSLLLGCRVASLFVPGGTPCIIWTERPLRDTIGEEEEDMPHTIVRLREDYYDGPLRVSDILQ